MKPKSSFFRGYIMMLKLYKWSQEIWSKNVIFKCKNYVPHLLFHVQIVVFRNSFFRHINKASLRSAQFFLSTPTLTWNPGSAPDDLNMYIINVIADDESKIGLYEIYFLND
jgi:hypothetical protein